MSDKYKTYISEVAHLESALRNLLKEQLTFRIGEDQWNIKEIVAHLADTEIQVYTRLRSILADDVPFLENHNEAKWTTAFRHSDIAETESLSLFKLIRGINYRLIETLSEAQFEMKGLHSTRGWMTAGNLVKGHIVHLKNHIGQIERNLKEHRKSKAK